MSEFSEEIVILNETLNSFKCGEFLDGTWNPTKIIAKAMQCLLLNTDQLIVLFDRRVSIIAVSVIVLANSNCAVDLQRPLAKE